MWFRAYKLAHHKSDGPFVFIQYHRASTVTDGGPPCKAAQAAFHRQEKIGLLHPFVREHCLAAHLDSTLAFTTGTTGCRHEVSSLRLLQVVASCLPWREKALPGWHWSSASRPCTSRIRKLSIW